MCLIEWIGWDGLTAIGTCALAVIGGLTVWYAARQFEDFRNESRIKHLIDLVDQFEKEPLATYRRQLGATRVQSGGLKPLDVDDPPSDLHNIMNFFEHMGYLLEGNYIDLHGVSVEFHYWVLHVWADAHEVIKREQQDESVYYQHFEKMANRLQEYDRKATGKVGLPSKEDIEAFYVEEAQLPSGSPIPLRRRARRRTT